MDVLSRNNVTVTGQTGPLMIFSHGFGCDQTMWRSVASQFEPRARVVLFDHVGAGGSVDEAYEEAKYASLAGYAADVIEIVEALGAGPVIFVGHSVSATIGVLAAVARPELFRSLVLVCASPRYIDTDGYRGGFTERDVEDLLELMDKNTTDWSAMMAPHVAGASAPKVQSDWQSSVCRINPTIAKAFARATFLSDHRADYALVRTPTLLIDSEDDVLAPDYVGQWISAAVPDSSRVVLPTEGHSPHMTAPDLTAGAIARELDQEPFRRAAQ
ncbi:MAG: alpha/beta hydrolase [Alphaproteobacteria bacterium]|nr:alpha/beta hydrolase [Alphaproteobacteria bacterium]MBU2270913.1 alpha/beta hydrolase [Alphaproteobacteria bacterium]MBU2418306.1 alpha/beta hydrolase [Alphaproteobacteria bacterium]